MSKYHHIILFRLKDGISGEQNQHALALLNQAGQGCQGLERWEVHESVDGRKGHIIILESLFASEEDFQNFHNSEKHNEATSFLCEVADWWVGDYVE
ncbi:MAG TPA: Dabb family protein [Candidatus Saccharimonadia bacterium]